MSSAVMIGTLRVKVSKFELANSVDVVLHKV